MANTPPIPSERLTRWWAATRRARQIVCVGDSITHGTAGRAPHVAGIKHNWVDQLATALDDETGPRPGDGFRGLWRTDEWKRSEAWTRTEPSAPFDVAPFGEGYYSSGSTVDRLAWSKPADLRVTAFDLYWFHMPGVGNWQYRVDDGPWRNAAPPNSARENQLCKLFVPAEVSSGVEIRGYDGTRACVAPIAGIRLYAHLPAASSGTTVHNLGQNLATLSTFCRSSAGDPLALLDDIRPDLVTVMFSNDVLIDDAGQFGDRLRVLIERVNAYADVLVISPYEQRPPRAVNDAITRSGSAVVTSATASFVPTDIGWGVTGADIPVEARIASVQSPDRATLSAAATASCTGGVLTIGRGRDSSVQAEYRAIAKQVAEANDCAVLDLFEAWSAMVGAGWDAANAAGLMHDRLHPSQLGHDDIARRIRRVLAAGPD
jgi:lysophospholipase L1-like esterase